MKHEQQFFLSITCIYIAIPGKLRLTSDEKRVFCCNLTHPKNHCRGSPRRICESYNRQRRNRRHANETQGGMSMITCQRHLFDLPDEYAYLNCAYTSPMLKKAKEGAISAINAKSSPWTIKPVHFFTMMEENRSLFAQMIDTEADNIAITTAVSYGIALAAKNIPVSKGQKIIVLQDQFPSNVYAWRKLAALKEAEIVTVPRPGNSDFTPAILEAITPDTAIAALQNCHWTDGAVIDLVKVGEKCRETGTVLVIDAIQSLGAIPFSVKKVQPDFVATATHKWLLGGYGYGFCYVAPKWQNGDPLEENWLTRKDSENFAGLVDYKDDYQKGARRFDVGGASNFQLAPVVNAGLRQILTWGVENIAATLKVRIDDIAQRAEHMGFIPTPTPVRSPHMLGIGMKNGIPASFLEDLANSNVFVSIRGKSVRIAPHLYNTELDVAKLFEALKKTV